MSNASAYLQSLGSAIAERLGFQFMRSRNELRRAVPQGHDVVVLSSSAKWSPFINVSFYFGKNYAAARKIESALKTHKFIYHVQQFASGRQALHASTYSGPNNWDVDLREPPQDLPEQIAAAIQAIAEPFFDQFAEIKAARDAIASNDRRCFSGAAYWHQLLLLDMALGDINPFLEWSTCLSPLQSQQAAELIAKYRTVTSAA